jgi:hypothetical protein
VAEILPFQPLLKLEGAAATAEAGAGSRLAPALLVLRQEFRTEGGLEKSRLGLMAALLPEGDAPARELVGLEVEPGEVEKELVGLRATGMQQEPVAAAVEDLDFHLEKLLERGIFLRDRPDGQWTSAAGDRHRVWRMEDASLVASLGAFCRGKDLFLLDGLATYRALRRLRESPTGQGSAAPCLPMVTIFNLFDFALSFSAPILLVREIPGFNINTVALRVHADFEVRSFPISAAVRLPRALTDFREDLRLRGFTESVVGAFFAGIDTFFIFQLREGIDRERVFLPDVPKPMQELDAILLRKVLLERHLCAPGSPAPDFAYCHSTEEAVGWVRAGRFQAAFFTNPPNKRKVAQTIRSGFRLPAGTLRLEPQLPQDSILKGLP